MKTGLTKKQKVTELWFTEADTVIFVRTYNTQLKNRLLEFSRTNPECCCLTDDDGMGGLEFEVDRNRLSIRLTKPYTDDRRKAASIQAKEMYVSNGGIGKCKKDFDGKEENAI